MTLGAIENANDNNGIVSQGDSAELRAFVYDSEASLIPEEEISSAEFTIQKPDGIRVTGSGIVDEDGTAFYRSLDTEDKGKYLWAAKFTLTNGRVKSFRNSFIVTDPFDISAEGYESVAEAVWLRLEDTFDSQEGGPWLRDMTLAHFDKTKILQFINEGILLINVTQPMTELSIDYFFHRVEGQTFIPLPASDPDAHVIIEATLISVIKHLMRSYVEQPDPRGANIVYQDRRDYLQRWQSVYQVEWDYFQKFLIQWKRQFLQYGHTKLLVNSKAGRLFYPGMRARNSQRGYN